MGSPSSSAHPRVLVLPSSMGLKDRTAGGGERYATEYTRALARLTHAEQALFSDEPADPPTDGAPSRVLLWKRKNRTVLPPLPRQTWEAFRQYDVLHLMCFPTSVSDGILASGILRSQIVVLTDIGGGGRCVTSYLTRLHPGLNPYRFASGFAHLSRYAASLFNGWNRPETILHGGASPSCATTHPRFDGYALFVGRLLPHKGVLELIKALPAGRELRIVGRPYDPDYFKQLQLAAAGRNIQFLTDASDEELARQYQGASVVLQPSIPCNAGPNDRSELLGLVAIEAQASGKPVIVTTTTSLPEVVQDGLTGHIVPALDIPALHDAIERFLGNPDYARKLGAQAGDYASRHYTWDAVAQRGLDFYRHLLDRRRSGA